MRGAEQVVAQVDGDSLRGAPLYEAIYMVLRAHLEAGKLPAGLIVGEAAVARLFKASRIPAGAALRRLFEDGLLESRAGRGFIVGGDAEPIRLSLDEAGIELPASLEARATRNLGERIYPEVEHAVAACLGYGRFFLNESALAAYYKVSRTVAHEVLTKLERTGIVSQDINQRWYAGPLTSDGIRHHFEMRWLLEPEALRQAFPHLKRVELLAHRERIAVVTDGRPSAIQIEDIERDLHFKTLSHCPNPLLLETVRRSQLQLLATHSTFEHREHADEIAHMAQDHTRVFDALIDDDIKTAASELEAHLRRAMQPNIDLWLQIGELPDALSMPYLNLLD